MLGREAATIKQFQTRFVQNNVLCCLTRVQVRLVAALPSRMKLDQFRNEVQIEGRLGVLHM